MTNMLTEVTHTVRLRDRGVDWECPPDATLLDSAAAAGIALTASCGRGLCGTCKLLLVDGEVDMPQVRGLRQPDRDAGYILACSATPLTDLDLDT